MADSVLNSLGSKVAERLVKQYDRCKITLTANYHLGFTAFGGPPVHFQIVSGPIFTSMP